MRRLLALLIVAMVAAAAGACDRSTTTTAPRTTTIDFSTLAVQAFATTSGAILADVDGIVPWVEATAATITLDDTVTYEPYRGVGAALTYSAAWVIDQSPDRDAIIEYVFGAAGLGVQLVRLCVGSSDFTTSAAGHYTYDDTVGNVPDTDLSAFSIEKDRVIIDVLKDALAINPDLQVIAAPWSAPAWMKTNKRLYGGALSATYYDVYADYLVRFIEAYASEGIGIDLLSVQNEPYYAPSDYPGMTWTVATTETFLVGSLGPALAAAGLDDVGILVWDHNPVDGSGNAIDFPTRILAGDAAGYVDAVGVHCYSGDDRDMAAFLDGIRATSPTVEILMTECTATTAYTDRMANIEWSVRRMYLSAYQHGASGTTYWNLALGPTGAPHLGGCSTCTGLVTVDTDAFHPEADGILTAHFARYVHPGALRIQVRSAIPSILPVAYLDTAGTITLVLWNDGAARSGSILWRGMKCVVPLAANSLTTVTWTMPETETP